MTGRVSYFIKKRTYTAKAHVCLFTLSFFLPLCYSYSQTIGDTVDIFSQQNRLQFGNYLFCENDFIRAIDEFRVYLRTGDNDTVQFKIGYALSKTNNYLEAEAEFQKLFTVSKLSDKAKLEVYKLKFFAGDYKGFQKMTVYSNNIPPEYAREISRLSNIIYLKQNAQLPDSTNFKNVFEKEFRKSMMNFYERKSDPGYKSAVKAALLSTLLPGLGKIYTGQYTDGITSFLLTGILAFLAYDNFRADHSARGWIFSGLAGLFYAGNIYGSAASAHIYNTQIKLNFNLELDSFLGINNYFLPEWDFLCK